MDLGCWCIATAVNAMAFGFGHWDLGQRMAASWGPIWNGVDPKKHGKLVKKCRGNKMILAVPPFCWSKWWDPRSFGVWMGSWGGWSCRWLSLVWGTRDPLRVNWALRNTWIEIIYQVMTFMVWILTGWPLPRNLNACASYASCLDACHDVIVNCKECFFSACLLMSCLILHDLSWALTHPKIFMALSNCQQLPKQALFYCRRNPSTTGHHMCLAILRVQHFLPPFFSEKQCLHHVFKIYLRFCA